MGMQQFGPGMVWVSGLGNTGNRVLLGALKSAQITIDPSQKLMYGSKQVAMYAGTDKVELKGSAEFETISLAIFMALGLGQLSASGTASLSAVPVVDDASQTIATNTMTITGATDILMVRTPIALGLLPAGSALTKVASGPVSGQYSVSGSAITYAAADVTSWGSNKPLVTWLKTATTDTNQIQLINQPIQQTVYFGIETLAWFDAKYRWHRYPRCITTKFPNPLESKDDFAKHKLEFQVLADPNTDVIGSISLTEGT